MLKNLVPYFKVLVPLPRAKPGIPGEEKKKQVISTLVSMAGIRNAADSDEIVEALLFREAKGSTGLGNGIAIPHVRTECVEKPLIVLGISPEGIDWDAQDGRAVVLFFLILVPLEQSDLYLTILSRLTRLVRTEGFVEKIRDCSSEEEVLSIMHDFELKQKLRAAGALSSGEKVR